MSGDAVYEHNRCGYNRHGYDNDRSDGSDDSDGECGQGGGRKHHEMEDCHKTLITVMKWINVQDSEVKMKGLDIDIDKKCSTMMNPYLIPIQSPIKKIKFIP